MLQLRARDFWVQYVFVDLEHVVICFLMGYAIPSQLSRPVRSLARPALVAEERVTICTEPYRGDSIIASLIFATAAWSLHVLLPLSHDSAFAHQLLLQEAGNQTAVSVKSWRINHCKILGVLCGFAAVPVQHIMALAGAAVVDK